MISTTNNCCVQSAIETMCHLRKKQCALQRAFTRTT